MKNYQHLLELKRNFRTKRTNNHSNKVKFEFGPTHSRSSSRSLRDFRGINEENIGKSETFQICCSTFDSILALTKKKKICRSDFIIFEIIATIRGIVNALWELNHSNFEVSTFIFLLRTTNWNVNWRGLLIATRRPTNSANLVSAHHIDDTLIRKLK